MPSEKIEAVRSAYERGMTMQEIATRYDVHRSAAPRDARIWNSRTPETRILHAKLAQLKRQHRGEWAAGALKHAAEHGAARLDRAQAEREGGARVRNKWR